MVFPHLSSHDVTATGMQRYCFQSATSFDTIDAPSLSTCVVTATKMVIWGRSVQKITFVLIEPKTDKHLDTSNEYYANLNFDDFAFLMQFYSLYHDAYFHQVSALKSKKQKSFENHITPSRPTL